jgi:hypothetical protein
MARSIRKGKGDRNRGEGRRKLERERERASRARKTWPRVVWLAGRANLLRPIEEVVVPWASGSCWTQRRPWRRSLGKVAESCRTGDAAKRGTDANRAAKSLKKLKQRSDGWW